MRGLDFRHRPPGVHRCLRPPTSATPTARSPGMPFVDGGELISTNPMTGAEVGRFPIADAGAVSAAVGPGPDGRALVARARLRRPARAAAAVARR